MNQLLDLDKGKKPQQKLQPIQAYSQLFYDTRLRDIIEPRWKAHLLANPTLGRADRLAFQNKTLKELLAAEPEVVRQEVEEYRQLKNRVTSVEVKELESDEGLSIEERERRREAREIQAYVHGVFFLFSAPDPDTNDLLKGKSTTSSLFCVPCSRDSKQPLGWYSGALQEEPNRSEEAERSSFRK